MPHSTQLTAVLGLAWGDEGKGKLVDILAGHSQIVARFGGGANAGHTIYVRGEKFVLHQLPSGVLHPQTKCVIGNGCVVHVPQLLAEVHELHEKGIDVNGRIFLSDRATLLFGYHQLLDQKKEAAATQKIGTTGRGIGPAYADKISRTAFRAGDLRDFASFAPRLRTRLEELNATHHFEIDIETELAAAADHADRLSGMICDTGALLREALKAGHTVLAEGAQAALLDIDHGTYPFVTSSSTTIGGVFTGLGVPPQSLESVGVLKAYTTRVGEGPCPTELLDTTGEQLREIGHEYGATTGRPRRCRWLDLFAAKYAAELNGVTSLNVTKLDVLNDFAELKVCVGYTDAAGEPLKNFPGNSAELATAQPIYETLPGWQCDISHARTFDELPAAARNYLLTIERFLGAPVRWIGTGPGREEMIER